MSSLSRLVTDDVRFLREAAVSGLGVAMLPELMVVDDLHAGRLHRVLDDFQSIELGIHALHPHGRLAPASVRAFVDHLASAFREPRWETALRGGVRPQPTKTKGRVIALTEQDVHRLSSVVALYSESEPVGSARLGALVARAKWTLASKVPPTIVTMNSRIRGRDGAAGLDRELALVYPWEAARDRISILSPLGRALLGAEVGARVSVGGETLALTSMLYQPEAAGDHHL